MVSFPPLLVQPRYFEPCQELYKRVYRLHGEEDNFAIAIASDDSNGVFKLFRVQREVVGLACAALCPWDMQAGDVHVVALAFPSAICMMDVRGNMVNCNPSDARLSKIPANVQFIDASWSEYLTEILRARRQCADYENCVGFNESRKRKFIINILMAFLQDGQFEFSTMEEELFMPLDDFKEMYKQYLISNGANKVKWIKDHYKATFADRGLSLLNETRTYKNQPRTCVWVVGLDVKCEHEMGF